MQDKSIFWGIRVSEPLKDRVMAEANRRGMNLSEFVRYALNSFFDRYDDSRPHDGDRTPIARGQGVLLEPRAEYEVEEVG